jgi:hypothetical protein
MEAPMKNTADFKVTIYIGIDRACDSGRQSPFLYTDVSPLQAGIWVMKDFGLGISDC